MPEFDSIEIKKYKKLHKKHSFFSFFVIFLACFCIFCIIFNISDIASSLITHRHGLFFVDKIDVPSYTIYAVSCEYYESESDAISSCYDVKKIGAMGRVLKHGEYYVLTSTYPTLLEAQEVQKNLINLGYDSRILNINVPSLLQSYRGDDREMIENAVMQFRRIYLALYEIDIDFDKGELSRSSFNGKLAQIMTQTKTVVDDFARVKKFDLKDKIMLGLNSATSKMDEILYSSLSNAETSSLVKCNMLDIVEINIDICSI